MAALPAPDAILQGVQLAHKRARAAPPRASDSFLIWSGGCGTDPNSVTQADKKRVVGGIFFLTVYTFISTYQLAGDTVIMNKWF